MLINKQTNIQDLLVFHYSHHSMESVREFAQSPSRKSLRGSYHQKKGKPTVSRFWCQQKFVSQFVSPSVKSHAGASVSLAVLVRSFFLPQTFLLTIKYFSYHELSSSTPGVFLSRGMPLVVVLLAICSKTIQNPSFKTVSSKLLYEQPGTRGDKGRRNGIQILFVSVGSVINGALSLGLLCKE